MSHKIIANESSTGNSLAEVTATKLNTKTGLDVVVVNSGLDFSTNDVDESGTTLYVGKSNQDTWLLTRIIDTSGDLSIRYATIENNISVLNYSDAWTNRATLTYDMR